MEMIYWQVSVGYTFINLLIALIIITKVKRSFISQFYFLCVLLISIFGISGYLLNVSQNQNLNDFLRPLLVLLYSIIPFFFIHFIIVYVGSIKILKSKFALFLIYFTGLFSYTMILLGYIPKPFNLSGAITTSSYIFYITWMSIFFTIGVAQLYSLLGGFAEKNIKSRMLFTGFVLLLFLLPGPFSESILSVAFLNNNEAYFFTSILGLIFAVYYVFRHKATVTLFDSLKLTLSVMKDVILKTDENFKIEYARGAVKELLGYTEAELVALDLTQILEDPGYLNGYRDFTRNNKMKEGFFDVVVISKDGERIPMNFSFTPMIDNEVITGYISIGRDIRERKKAENILQQSNIELEQKIKERTKELAKVNEELKIDIQKRLEAEEKLKIQTQELKTINENKDKLFSIVAHDLKSPFTAILGYSEYLAEDIEELDKNEIVSYAKSINTSAESIYNLLTNLLEWSILQSTDRKANPENFELNSIVETNVNLFQPIASDKKIKLINNIDSQINSFADKNMTESVIRNLISNAIKFTKEGGNVELNAKVLDQNVEVTINDSGIGISNNDIDKLFEMSEDVRKTGTKKEKGTGLGLPLCKEFVELNGGKIWVESFENKGSSFKFTLPASKSTA